MYAVVRSGSKQLRVEPGQRVRVEKLPGQVGDSIALGDVLLVGNDGGARIGTPTLAGARVVGTITAQDRGPKITIFKVKRRNNYRRKQGHRQAYTEIRITGINA
jgi:large subunit ribosomal protein L21